MFKFISKLSIAFLLGVATTLPVVQAVATAVNCPNDARIVGYNNFYDLRESLHSGGTRILCPGTTFYVDQEITISSFATLQCGTNGDADDKCIIKGGARQLNIVGEGGQFVGITFQGATSGALRIHTSQSENGRAVFRDCVFEKHGNAANEDALGSVATVYRGGQAVFENCLFRQNVAFKALLDIKDGDVTIIDSIFQESFAIMNSFYDGAGLVYVDGANAHLDLLNSCFIRNM